VYTRSEAVANALQREYANAIHTGGESERVSERASEREREPVAAVPAVLAAALLEEEEEVCGVGLTLRSMEVTGGPKGSRSGGGEEMPTPVLVVKLLAGRRQACEVRVGGWVGDWCLRERERERARARESETRPREEEN
jgi:hypothetical protein